MKTTVIAAALFAVVVLGHLLTSCGTVEPLPPLPPAPCDLCPTAAADGGGQ